MRVLSSGAWRAALAGAVVGLVLSLGVGAAGAGGVGSVKTSGTGGIADTVLPAGAIMQVQATSAQLTAPAHGRLRVPGLSVAVDGVAWPASSASDPDVVAGPGHRLVVVVLSLAPPTLANDGTDAQPTVSLVMGQQVDSLGPIPIGYPASSRRGDHGAATFVASVPADDHDVLLQVAAEGVTQELDLWTLQPVVAATGPGLLQAISVTDTATGQTGPTYVILQSATPSAFDPGGPQRAPAGQAYLVLRFLSTVSFLDRGLPPSCRFIASIAPLPGTSVTVTPTGGTASATQAEDPVPPAYQQPPTGDSGLLDAAYVAMVPTGLTAATVTVVPSTTTGTPYAGCNRAGGTDPLQVAGPSTFTVRFPAIPAAGVEYMPPWIGAPPPPTGTLPATVPSAPGRSGGTPTWPLVLGVLAVGVAVMIERAWRRRRTDVDLSARLDLWVAERFDAEGSPHAGGGNGVPDGDRGPGPSQAAGGDRETAGTPLDALPAPLTARGELDAPGPLAPAVPHVELAYQLAKHEVVGAIHARLVSTWQFSAAGLLGVICLVVGIDQTTIARAHDQAWFWGFLTAMGAVYLLFFVLAFMGPYRSWAANAELRGPVWLAVSEDGVHSRTMVTDRRTAWAGYAAVFEVAGAYLLRHAGSRLHSIVPKRAFASPDDEERFRDLVTRNTDAHLRRTDRRRVRTGQGPSTGREADQPL